MRERALFLCADARAAGERERVRRRSLPRVSSGARSSDFVHPLRRSSNVVGDARDVPGRTPTIGDSSRARDDRRRSAKKIFGRSPAVVAPRR
ncbi:hypothetical protein, partial [Dokdonella sp.]|uniref:hypothetical protein n=1 Tax=Dokdonella sp. TaxID=2291710 RepID=UPI002F3F702D